MLAFESRRAKEIEALISTFGGRPLVAPAMREVPNQSDAAALDFAEALIAGRFDAVMFLTGVGVRALVDTVERAGRRPPFLDALARSKVITRGPKPVAVLRELQIPIWANAPEPNTWRELMAVLDEHDRDWPLAGKRVAVQEYGVSNVELLEALRAKGADVTAIQAYQWALPEDLAPLRSAIETLVRGDIDVALFTTATQVTHLRQVAESMGLGPAVHEALNRIVVASIGPTTSEELREQGIRIDLEPTHPKMGFLVREAAERAGDLRK